MHYYSLTATCSLLTVAQAVPLIVGNSIIFDSLRLDDSAPLQQLEQSNSPYLTLSPSTENQLFYHTSPNQPTAYQLFDLTPSTENQQLQDLNIVLSTYGDQLEAAAQDFVPKGCDNPENCQLCDSTNQCQQATISTDNSNGPGKICLTGSTAQDPCVPYTLYIATESCASGDGSKDCKLCHPNNGQNCISAVIWSKTTGNRTVKFFCPLNRGTGVNCVYYDTVIKCASPDGTSC